MHETIIKKLYDKFVLSTRQGQGGMTFKYVPNEDVINRMNEIFKGEWSTFVKFKDIIDDQVILEVEVKIVDPDTKMSHSHTGFGSQQIMRYKSGPNNGQIIDIGNGYKGALAKAIVNACTRWGVGLFKESDPSEAGMPSVPTTVVIPNNNPMPSVEMPLMPGTVPEPPVAAPPPPSTATPPASPYVVETTAVPNMVPPPMTPSPVPPPPTVVMAAPPVVEPVVVENTTTFPPPMAPEQPVSASVGLTQELPPTPPPTENVIPTTPDLPFSKEEGLGSIGISDVQKVALNGILTMNNADYGELAIEAFTANGIAKAVPNREDLSYEEAVVVIKFGNEKYRKNR